jgi:hypothetical protein
MMGSKVALLDNQRDIASPKDPHPLGALGLYSPQPEMAKRKNPGFETRFSDYEKAQRELEEDLDYNANI